MRGIAWGGIGRFCFFTHDWVGGYLAHVPLVGARTVDRRVSCETCGVVVFISLVNDDLCIFDVRQLGRARSGTVFRTGGTPLLWSVSSLARVI